MSDSATYEKRHARAAETVAVFAPEVDPERFARSLGRRLGALGGFAFEVVGETWSRPARSRRDRSLIVIATLAVAPASRGSTVRPATPPACSWPSLRARC